MPRLRIDQYLSFCLLILIFLVTPGNNFLQLLLPRLQLHAEAQFDPPELITQSVVPVLKAAALPTASTATPEFFAQSLTASAIYVMDRDCGCILLQKNSDERRYPASTSKLLTALVARKVYNLDDVLTMTPEAGQSVGTSAHLQPGEKFYIRDVLPALLIPSGNDAADMLALQHPGGKAGFIQDMNSMATQLHLDSSHFDNASGLDSPDQFVSARDLAILAQEVMKDDVLRILVGLTNFTIFDLSDNAYHLRNTNNFLGVLPGVVGVKTGTTENAGENLIVQIDRQGHRVIIVVMGSTDRYTETRQIIDWVFDNYSWNKVDHIISQ